MSTLLGSHTYIDQIKQLSTSNELKVEINRFIDNAPNFDFDRRFSELLFRCNLSYIIENINKNSLLEELRDYNNRNYGNK